MEHFVLDCSVTMAWCFHDEATSQTDDLLDAMTSARRVYAPVIWPLEVINVLLVAERRNRISRSDASRFLSLLWTLPITIDLDLSPSILKHIFDIGSDEQLSAYDAAYLEVAMRKGVALATLDARMKAVAGQLKIPCLT